MKILNVKGIAIVAAVLLILHFASGLVLSPLLAPAVMNAINDRTAAKIMVEKAVVWPLTLSCSFEGLKVFDPDNENVRIVLVEHASMKLSLLALLSKRVVINDMVLDRAYIDLIGEPDGSFNIQKLARAKGETGPKPGLLDIFKGKKDLFTRIYDIVKKKSAKTEQVKKTGKVERKIQDLPRGRRVNFIRPKDQYLFEINNLEVKDSRLNFTAETGETIEVDRAGINIKGLKVDPVTGTGFNKIAAKGILSKGGKTAGNFDVHYSQNVTAERQTVGFDISAKEIDMTAVKFIYKNSLPVDFEKGLLSINSRTDITNGALRSEDALTLEGHKVIPKNTGQVVGFVPMPALCDAINQVDPFKMKFKIGGTAEKPELSGFEDVLLSVVKPYIGNIAKNIEKEGIKALTGLLGKDAASGGQTEGQPAETTSSTEETAKKAVESLKQLFSDEKK